MSRDQVVEGFLRALAAQDRGRAADFLSPAFGMQGGTNRAGHLRWEMEQFRERLRLLAPGFTVRPIRIVGDAHVYGIFDHRDWFLVEDEFYFGSDGLLVGNQRHFDVVTKLHFRMGQPVRRAVAVPRPLAHHARVLAAGVSDTELAYSVTEQTLTLKFALEDDDLQHRLLPIRVMSREVVVTHEVEFRGLSSPYFVTDMYARIKGSEVRVPADRMNIWSLTVIFEDGSAVEIQHPDRGRYEFGRRVARTFITDALDHDWEAVAGHD